MRSRSVAISFMRWFMRSRANMGIATDSTVANTQIAANTVAKNWGFMTVSTKLIIVQLPYFDKSRLQDGE